MKKIRIAMADLNSALKRTVLCNLSPVVKKTIYFNALAVTYQIRILITAGFAPM
jgi:hypothetical protein